MSRNPAIASPSRGRLPAPLRRLLASDLVATLATPHGVDRYLELFNPLWSVSEVRAEIVAIVRETTDATTIRLRPNGNWLGARAGQYVRIAAELNGVRRSRCYSVSSSARRADGLIDITVKTVAGGAVSGPLSAAAHPGMIVTLSQAEGSYVLPDAATMSEGPTHFLFISGGSGITPNMAMLRTLLDDRYAGRITVLHYAPTYDDVIFGSELVRLADAYPNVELRFGVTRATPDGDDFAGHFSAAHLAALDIDPSSVAAYVCGPQSLIDAVRNEFAIRNQADRLQVEQFTAAAPAAVAEAVGGEVRFARAERYVASDGRSLLDQAEAAGLKPEAGCRMGICMSCKCTKKSGVTKNLITGELSTEAGEDIQLCVSVPLGDVTLDI
ncbi:MAG: ferredoxin reductase [Pseudomonadota bacterium]